MTPVMSLRTSVASGAGDVDRVFGGLMRRVYEHPALSHPLLGRLASGEVSVEELRAYAIQHYLYARGFIRNMAALASNVPDERVRAILIENMYEEIGEPGRVPDQVLGRLLRAGYVDGEAVGRLLDRHADANTETLVDKLVDDGAVSEDQLADVVAGDFRDPVELTHASLLRRFMTALGASPADIVAERCLPETEELGELYLEVCSSEPWLVGMGAMGPGTECVVPELYRPVLAAIRATGAVSPRDYVFWSIHVHCDEGHGRNILEALVPYASSASHRSLIERGAVRALDARCRWLDAVERYVFGNRSTGGES